VLREPLFEEGAADEARRDPHVVGRFAFGDAALDEARHLCRGGQSEALVLIGDEPGLGRRVGRGALDEGHGPALAGAGEARQAVGVPAMEEVELIGQAPRDAAVVTAVLQPVVAQWREPEEAAGGEPQGRDQVIGDLRRLAAEAEEPGEGTRAVDAAGSVVGGGADPTAGQLRSDRVDDPHGPGSRGERTRTGRLSHAQCSRPPATCQEGSGCRVWPLIAVDRLMSPIVLVPVVVLVLGFCSLVPKFLRGNARSARLPPRGDPEAGGWEYRNQRSHESTAPRALRIDARGDRKPNRR